MSDEQNQIEIEVTSPVVVDLGKTKKKHVKRLKKHEGKLMDEVDFVMDEVLEALGEDAEGKVFVPIVIVYRKEDKDKGYSILGL